MTLVNRNFKERCTIDRDLQYTKTGGRKSVSPLALALREERIRASGFSKYCIGRVLTDPDLKRNAFKIKIRKIQKATHTNTDLYNLKTVSERISISPT